MSFAWGAPPQNAAGVSNGVASILEMFKRRRPTPGPIDPNELRKQTLPWLQRPMQPGQPSMYPVERYNPWQPPRLTDPPRHNPSPFPWLNRRG